MHLAIAGAILTLTLGYSVVYAMVDGEVKHGATGARCVNEFEVKPTASASPTQIELGTAYYDYFRKKGDGTLKSTIADLENLRANGVQTIIISPPHPQTVEIMNAGNDNETVNDHGYWISSLEIDEAIGGWDTFRLFVKTAHQKGMRVLVDMVFDHVGYSDTAEFSYTDEQQVIFKKTVGTDIKTFFRNNYDEKQLTELYDRYNRETDPRQSIVLYDLLTKLQWNEDLPVLVQENSWVREWHFHSFRKMIDQTVNPDGSLEDDGIDGGRLDAAKHISRFYLLDQVNSLGDYAKREYNKTLVFLAEHMVFSPPSTKENPYPHNYVPLLAVVDFFTKNARYPVYFIDFQFTDQIRYLNEERKEKTADGQLVNIPFGFDNLAKIIRHRESLGIDALSMLVNKIEDHDFRKLINFGKAPTDAPHNGYILHAVSDFFAPPGVLYHGGENLIRLHDNSRGAIPGINPNGDIGKMKRLMNSELDLLRKSPHFFHTKWHEASYHNMIAEKTDEHGNSLILIISRGAGLSEDIPSQLKFRSDSIDVIFDSSISLEHDRIKGVTQVDNRPRGFSFELSRDHHHLHVETRNNVVVLLRIKKDSKYAPDHATTFGQQSQPAAAHTP